jgi:hypothetical protein
MIPSSGFLTNTYSPTCPGAMKKGRTFVRPFQDQWLGNYCPSLLFMEANFAWSFVLA